MATVTVTELRRDFDGSFALPQREGASNVVDLLAIRVGGKPHALRISEISAVAVGRRVTPVPSSHAALSGLVGVRGALVAVFDLGALLGEQPSAEAPRWVALAAGGNQLALAFHEVEGHIRLPLEALQHAPEERRHLFEHVVLEEGELRPIVSVPRIEQKALNLTGRERPGKGE